MKIIEALKQTQDLARKVDDLKRKIGLNSAHFSHETPVYKDQTKQVSEWIQACCDIIKEIARLRVAIQMTNLVTSVTIVIDGKEVTKSLAEWIHWRRDLADLRKSVHAMLGDKGLKEGTMNQSTGEQIPVTVIRCYDPVERDKQVEIYAAEPKLIDGKLEVVNATTDLIEGTNASVAEQA